MKYPVFVHLHMIIAMVGSSVSQRYITNVGNTLESMDLGFEISTSPPTSDVVAFLTTGVSGLHLNQVKC